MVLFGDYWLNSRISDEDMDLAIRKLRVKYQRDEDEIAKKENRSPKQLFTNKIVDPKKDLNDKVELVDDHGRELRFEPDVRETHEQQKTENIANGWELVEALKWEFNSSGIQTDQMLRSALDSLSRQDRISAILWLRAKADELAGQAKFRDKNRNLLLQIAAFGKVWFQQARDNPDAVRFLEAEIQPVEFKSTLDQYLA